MPLNQPTAATVTTHVVYGNSGNLHPSAKLCGASNYATWKFEMQSLLISDGLWKCVMGADTDPDRDERALAKINLNVQRIVYPYIIGKEKAKDAWDALEATFQDKGHKGKYALQRSLFRIELTNFESIEAYVGHILLVHQTLTDIGAPFSDEILANIMLGGWPDSFATVIDALEGVNRELSSDIAKKKLLSLHNGGHGGTNATPSESAIFVKNKGAAGKSSVTCYYCKKVGHMKFACPVLKKKLSGGQSKSPVSDKSSKPAVLATGSGSGYAVTSRPNVLDSEREVSLLSVAMPAEKFSPACWLVDSGATHHMCYELSLFSEITECSKTVSVADSSRTECKGIGTVKVRHGNRTLKINDVEYVPGFIANLLSVSQLVKRGFVVVMEDGICTIMKPSVATFEPLIAYERNGLFCFGREVPQALVTSNGSLSAVSHNYDLWHARLGHPGKSVFNLVVRKNPSISADARDVSQYSRDACDTCVRGKISRKGFTESKTRTTEVLQLVHSDLCEVRVPSLNRNRYRLSFVDEYSRKVFLYLLPSKDLVFEKFCEFKALVETQTGKKIQIFRTDNGLEKINKRFSEFLRKCGIEHQRSVEYVHEQNGVAERMFRTTLSDKTRCLLLFSKLPLAFWGEALNTAAYRLPSRSIGNMVPEELWSGNECDLSNPRVFGCLCYAYVPKEKRKNKWAERAVRSIYARLLGNKESLSPCSLVKSQENFL